MSSHSCTLIPLTRRSTHLLTWQVHFRESEVLGRFISVFGAVWSIMCWFALRFPVGQHSSTHRTGLLIVDGSLPCTVLIRCSVTISWHAIYRVARRTRSGVLELAPVPDPFLIHTATAAPSPSGKMRPGAPGRPPTLAWLVGAGRRERGFPSPGTRGPCAFWRPEALCSAGISNVPSYHRQSMPQKAMKTREGFQPPSESAAASSRTSENAL